MAVKFTPSGVAETREVAEPCDPIAEFGKQLEECCRQFRSEHATPARLFAFEKALEKQAHNLLRQVLERELNRLESSDKKEMPAKVRYHKLSFRINKKTKLAVTSRFGTITLRSFYYLNEEDGEPGLHPLRLRLGIGAGSATPAFAEHVARLSVDHTQAEVRTWLLREQGVKWSNSRLRATLRGVRNLLLPLVPGLQKARLLAWLEQAQHSRGRYRPVLAAGRDGIMVPMLPRGYHEASTATVSVYDRRRGRLGTVYLGQMPEEKQTTLSAALTDLLKGTLQDWQGSVPRLVYVTDKGSAPDDYYHRVLKKMMHPRERTLRLEWEWVLDFYHVCSYIGKLADALFGAETKAGAAWFKKMRHWLRDRRQGVSQVLRSAMQLLDRRKMNKPQRTAFWKAYQYLRRHRRWMDYEGHRRRGLPIGSGVTEAACKTVFTHRFKRSGMRWAAETGQIILDLRVTYLSRVWDDAIAADLASRELSETPQGDLRTAKKASPRPMTGKVARFAA
jgi:hypothetical protein